MQASQFLSQLLPFVSLEHWDGRLVPEPTGEKDFDRRATLRGGLVGQAVSRWITLDPRLGTHASKERSDQLTPEGGDLLVRVLLWDACGMEAGSVASTPI